MTGKRKIQMAVDLLMTAILLLLMAYSLVGEEAHEWMGIGMFLLFLIHHGLNWKWHKNLFKGRYSGIRVMGTVLNVLIFLLMITLMVSGIAMSRYVFASIPLGGGTSLARTVHLIGSYWCYVLISVHLGLHGSMLMGMIGKACRIEKSSRRRKLTLRLIAALLAAYGIYAFLHRGLGAYMFLQSEFAFFDFSELIIFFLADYIAIMALFAITGYYAAKVCDIITNRNEQKSLTDK